jgi:transposase
MRARIIVLAADGLRNDEIAAKLDMPRQVVSMWRKRFFEEGRAGLAERGVADPPVFSLRWPLR